MEKHLLIPSNDKFLNLSITGILIFILFFFLPLYLYGHNGHNGHNNYAPPLHLSAVPQSPCQVDLRWTDCYSNETGFSIFRKSGMIDRFKVIHTANADETSWIDTSVEPGTLYSYFVKPLIPDRRWFYPHVYVATPEEPTAIPASPMNLTAVAVSPDRVNLEWSDLSDNEYGFRIERKTLSGEFIIVTGVLANMTEATDSSGELLPGTEYIYRIISFNPRGDSYPADEVKVTIPFQPVDTPAAPMNLSGIPVSLNQVSLTWTDNANNEASFFIERRKGDAGGFTVITEMPPDTEEYLDTGLEANTTYCYRVRAGNSKGFSPYTLEVDVTTMSPQKNRPEAPSQLIAAAKSAVQIDLSWIDNSDNEFGVIIQRRERNKDRCGGYHPHNRNFYFKNIAIVLNTTAWSDMNVRPDSCYEYRIFAFNNKQRSGLSKSTTACTPELPAAPPEAPSNLTGIPVSAHQINLSWKDNACNEYGSVIQRMTGGGEFQNLKILPPDATTWSDKNVCSIESYTYRIIAFNAAGHSQPSNEVTEYSPLPPTGLPTAPSHLEAAPLSSTQIRLSWIDNSHNEYGFGIERRTGNGEYRLTAVVPPNNSGPSVELVDAGLLPGTEYSYRVYAYNSKGNSAYSNKAHAVTFPEPGDPPLPPEIISAETLSPNTVLIKWVCNADNEEGFIIQRKKEYRDWMTIHITGVDVHEWIDNGVVPDTLYMYRIASFNSYGQSNWSAEYPVTPCVTSQIVFTVQPAQTFSGDTIPPVELEIQDSYGNRILDAGNSVTITPGANPAGGTLSGTLTVNAVNGKIVFDDLSLDKYGEGYTLIASSEGLPAIESDPFTILPLSLTVQNSGYGTTNPDDTVLVNYQDLVPISAQAQSGYHFVEWVVDNGTVTINEPDSAETTALINHGDSSITALFAVNTYTITTHSGPGGTITPSGEIAVGYGSSQEFVITASQNYHIQEVVIDGETIVVNNTPGNNEPKVFNFTFENVTTPHTIEASYLEDTFIITATAGENGSITPSGELAVAYGDSPEFTITPAEHYHIADVLIDGESAGAVSQYTFLPVTENHTIHALFEINTYAITATSEGQGTISPSGEIVVTCGDTVAFTMTPGEHYHIGDVFIDDVSVGPVPEYEFSQITSDHTIRVRFDIDTVVITATADPNGTISPAGNVAVGWGTDITFHITPSPGYEVMQVVVDGEQVGAVTSYTFENVTAPHTIHARFPEHLEWEWGTWNCGYNPTSEISVTTYDERETVLKLSKYANYHAKIYKDFSVQNTFMITLNYFPEAVFSSDWGPIMKIKWENGGIAWIQDRQSGFACWGMTGQQNMERNSVLRNGKKYRLRIKVTDTEVKLMYRETGSENEWQMLMVGNRDATMSGNIKIILGTKRLFDDNSPGNQEIYYYDNLLIDEGSSALKED